MAQISGNFKLTNASTTVKGIWEVTLASPVGTFTVGEAITFTAGATGEVVAWLPGVETSMRFSNNLTTHPVLGDTITGAVGGATATIIGFTAKTDWAADVSAGDLFTVAGSGVPYTVGSVTNASVLLLSSNYAGATDTYAPGYISSSFTTTHLLPYSELGDKDPETVSKQLAADLDGKLGNRTTTNIWDGGQHSKFNASTQSGAISLDLNASNTYHVTMSGNVTSIAFTNKPGDGGLFTVVMEQDATGGRTVASWAGINFGAAGTPTIPTAAGDQFVLALIVLASGDVLATFGDFS